MYENSFKTSITLISFKINRNLKWLLSFWLSKSVQIQLIHWKNNNFYFQLYKVCVVTVPYCMNCVLTVLCWSLYFHIFLFFCCYGTVVSCNSEVQCHTLVWYPPPPNFLKIFRECYGFRTELSTEEFFGRMFGVVEMKKLEGKYVSVTQLDVKGLH